MSHEVLAELVGTVFAVSVSAGDAVSAGDTIVILESMKMEIPVLTEIAGMVAKVEVAPGDNVRDGDVLAVIDAAP